jgi:uridine kinase
MLNHKKNDLYLFALILIAKIILFLSFSSYYSNDLFLPFLNQFAHSVIHFEFVSPWKSFLAERPDAFPYHPAMLYLYGIFQIPSVIFQLGLVGQKLLFIIPTLIADIAIFTLLRKLFYERRMAIILMYGFSPVILYSIYMHGQLDLWPTALLFLSAYLLMKDRYNSSAIVLGLAITFKLYVVAVLPLLIYFIYRKFQLITLLKYILIIITLYSVITIPWLLDQGFWQMVLLNQKQDLLWKVTYHIGENTLYLSLFAVLSIYLRFFGYVKVNKELLLTWITILLAVFVLLIPPSPGWYVWFTPFLLYFYLKYLKQKKQIVGLYGFFSLSYLFYFIFIWRGDYPDLLFLGETLDLKISNTKLSGIAFTLLQSALAANLYILYRIGVKSNKIYKRPQAILIGIGGDSGAGKSTLLHALEKMLHPSVTLLEGDGDHRWERGNQNYKKITHLNPRANYLERQAENLIKLKKGETIYRPDYDHLTGKFTEPEPVVPTDFIILSGLHPFYLPKMRQVTDIKIFIDTENQLRTHWKILRDIHKRGYEKKNIELQIKNRKRDSDKYILPQRNFADLIIEYYAKDKFKVGEVEANVQVCLKLTISSEYHIEELSLFMEDSGWLEEWDYGDDMDSQYFVFSSFPTSEQMNKIVSEYLPFLEDTITSNLVLDDGYLGIVQLFVLVMIIKKYQTYEQF